MNTKSDLELRLERIKRLGNLRLDYLQRFYNPEPISQGYAEYRLEVHIHADVLGARTCGVFSRRGPNCIGMSDKHEIVVLVQIGKLVQPACPLASIVRLQPLDCCYLVGGELTDKVVPWMPESAWRTFDRKMCATLGASGEDVQLTEQVIERTPEIPSCIANQDSASIWDWDTTVVDSTKMKCFSLFQNSLRLDLGDRFLSLSSADSIMQDFKLIQMFATPVQPQVGAM